MIAFLNRLRQGGQLAFAGATLDDMGVILTKHRLLRPGEQIYYTWPETYIYSDVHALKICAVGDTRVFISLSYQDVDNVHILEKALRILYKTRNPRLSSALDESGDEPSLR